MTESSGKRVAVVGSRDFPDEDMVKLRLRAVLREGDTVVSGGAKGPDTWGKEVADELGLATIIHHPEWERYGKAAGFRRNSDIVADSDVVLAFWVGTNGTLDTIKKAIEAGKLVYVFWPDGRVNSNRKTYERTH